MGTDFKKLKDQVVCWSLELGFQDLRVTDVDLAVAGERLSNWLANGFHGSMEFMQRHGSRRSNPDELVPGTIRVISVRMDYLPEPQESARALLDDESRAYVSRYALGRDYHKLMRRRLQKLADAIEERTGPFGYRAFVDSAPVLEKPLAEKAGIGWIGKHTNLINKDEGSWFFLGELYTDLPLPVDERAGNHCGTCTACIDVCPTKAIVAPYVLDARRCISYLTIENKGPIPSEFREAIGNRVYGCDDCQLFCPWNKFAKLTNEDDFLPRQNLDSARLTELFGWTEDEWLAKMEGSAIRRIGYDSWSRNIAVALGNAKSGEDVKAALQDRRDSSSELVREHIDWALARHDNKTNGDT
jgi:epoxyqueuosine reductase